MLAFASPKGLCALIFEEDAKPPINIKLNPYSIAKQSSQAHSQTLLDTKAWLSSYFAKRHEQPLPSIDLQCREFTMLALNALLKVPFGTTRSYGALAKALGRPKAQRAVGRAMNQNPIAILIPCHRIVGANGALTGYAAGLKRKEWLLRHEGILIN